MSRVDESLPRKEALRGKKNFERVYGSGDVHRTKHIVLFCLREAVEERKAGFVASKRLGKAAKRNRIRRRLREAYRKLRAELSDKAHLVFVARGGIAEVKWEGLLGEMNVLLMKAGLKKS